MKKVLLTIFGTTCIFAAGVFAGMWIQRTQPVPAPPIGFLEEIRDVPLSNGAPRPSAPANDAMPRLAADIEKLKPDIVAFKNKLDPIKTEFREQLDALLNDEQREKLKILNERVASAGISDANGGATKKSHDGLDALLPIVIVPTTLDRLSAELRLDDGQKAAVQALLLKRRARFLELVDTTPPPSLQLRRIAPLIPQIAQPASK